MRLSRPPNFSSTIARMAIRPVRSAGEEGADCRSDFVAMRLERKVPGVQETHFGTRNVALERLRARRQEEGIVLPPNRQKPRLVPAEIGLEFRVQRDVALIVTEKIELHLIGTGTRQVEAVERISVGRNRGGVSDAVGVLPVRCLRCEEGSEGRAV